MLIKSGVDISRLKPLIRSSMTLSSFLYERVFLLNYTQKEVMKCRKSRLNLKSSA